jgi:hypothetical protein
MHCSSLSTKDKISICLLTESKIHHIRSKNYTPLKYNIIYTMVFLDFFWKIWIQIFGASGSMEPELQMSLKFDVMYYVTS